MEGELIVMSFISLIGTVIILQLRDRAYFKKQNFKLQLDTVKAENRLKLKKLEREMGITSGSKKTEGGSGEGIAALLPLLKNLDPEQLTGLLDMLPGSAGGDLGSWIQDNPEIIKTFLDNFTQGAKTKEAEAPFQFEG
jgi:hypothetical protein